LLCVLQDLALNFVSHLTVLDASVGFLAHLDSDTITRLYFNISDNIQITAFRRMRRLSLINIELSFFMYNSNFSTLFIFR
jgi:hypothetical protein